MRNIGIAAHIDAGKTTLTERILFFTGTTHKIGEVHDGNAVMDYMPEEKQRGITITSAVTTVFWKKEQINIVDTPGHVDFTVEVERSMRVMDGAVIVLCAVGGVEPQTETIWNQVNKFKIPRVIFVNKLDRIGANFEKVILEIEKKLNITPIPITIPMGQGRDFNSIINILSGKEIIFGEDGVEFTERDFPDKDFIIKYRNSLVEKLVDFDNDLMEKYLEERDITPQDIESAIIKASFETKIAPLFSGSALKNKGIQQILDGIIRFLPTPDQISKLPVYDISKKGRNFIQLPEKDFLGYIFKVSIIDKRKICYVRVYSGKVNSGDTITNLTSNIKTKVSKIFKIHADKRTEIESCGKGDIVGMLLRDGNTGDTLTDNSKLPYILEKLESFNPVISLAIEPHSVKEQPQLIEALGFVAVEDPSFQFKFDEELNQIIISGMGELHLEVVTNKLLSNYNLKIKVGKPQVLYRETITKKSESENEYTIKIENDNYHTVTGVEIEPLPRTGRDNSSEIIIAAELPEKVKEFLLEASNEFLLSGLITGYPIIDIKITIRKVIDISGKYEKGIIKAATIYSLRDAYNKALPVKLEPIMDVVINTPEQYTGDIISELNSKKGKILNIDSEDDKYVITANVGLSKLFGFTTQLRSLSKGKADFSMKFRYYDKF